jgi:hypothetical protein
MAKRPQRYDRLTHDMIEKCGMPDGYFEYHLLYALDRNTAQLARVAEAIEIIGALLERKPAS